VYLLYDLLLLIAAAGLVPYYLLRGLRYGKSRRGIRERLGHYVPDHLEALQGREVIWVHAVSVGETRAALPLLAGLRREYPEALILLSNVTETGRAIAQESGAADLNLFFPFDFSWTVRRVLQLVRPRLVVIVETEIWPNFTRQAHRMGIPVLLVNGRISDRSFPRYQRFRLLLAPVLKCFSAFCMQSQLDAGRIVALGADPRQVETTGNLKFDHRVSTHSVDELAQLRATYRLPDDVLILTAGSTHAGEETQILSAYGRLLNSGLRLVLVLIPRRPERAREVMNLLSEQNLAFRQRSTLDLEGGSLKTGEVLLVDTLGEVLNLYAVSDLVFVGGSLVPVGGHNPLEASLLGKPVLFGPHMHNFREISAKLVDAGAGVRIHHPDQLVATVRDLLADPARRQAMGEAGRTLVSANAGATRRTLERIAACLTA